VRFADDVFEVPYAQVQPDKRPSDR
jgi:hypothetical protein